MKRNFKSSTVIAASILLTALTFGCKKNFDYTMETITEKTPELEAEVAIPQFKDKSLAKLNEELLKSKNAYETFKKENTEYWHELDEERKAYAESEEDIDYMELMPFSYSQESFVYINGEIISVLMNHWTYEGGAHGNLVTSSVCYDSKKNKFLTAEEVTGKTYEQLSQICIEDITVQLKKEMEDFFGDDMVEWIKEGASPENIKASPFSMKEGKVYIHFDPYKVAPYAFGPVDVEIK